MAGLWIIFLNDVYLNNDALVYLESARLITQGDIQGAYEVYPWPFYALLISAVHFVSGAPFHIAAYFLNAVFYGLTTAALAVLIRMAGGTRLTLLCGMILFIGNLYLSGDVLPMIIRDVSFWACLLASCVVWLAYMRNPSWLKAGLWSLLLVLAALFRVEGLVYLLALPAATACFWPELDSREKYRRSLRALALPAIAGLLMGAAMLLLVDDLSAYLGRLNEYAIFRQEAFNALFHTFLTQADTYGETILGGFMDEYSISALALSLLFIVLMKSIGSAGWVATLLALYTRKSVYQSIHADARTLAWSIMVIGFVIASISLFKTMIISGRYLAPVALMLTFFAAFGMAAAWEKLRQGSPTSRAWKIGLAVLLLLAAAGLMKNLLSGLTYDKNTHKKAADWMLTHKKPQDKVFYSNARLRYFAGESYEGRPDDWEAVMAAIEDGSIDRYQWLVIELPKMQPEMAQKLEQLLPLDLAYQTPAGKSRPIHIYKIEPGQ